MSSIAKQQFGFGGPKTVARILAVNPGVQPDRIYIGQVIYLPCGNGPAPEADAETAQRHQPRLNRATGDCAICTPITAL